MNFVKAAPYIKDYASALLSVVAIVIAILTYVRAKETILQPIRSEVIKKQTELLINILERIGNQNNINSLVDYEGIIRVNIYSSMLDCGTVFHNQDELEKMLKKEISGGFLGKRSEKHLQLVPVFEESSKKIKNPEEPSKDMWNNARKGRFKLPIIHLTAQYMKFYGEIDGYLNSPFLPVNVKKLLTDLVDDMQHNIIEFLPKEVEKAINTSFKNGGKQVPSATGVYNLYHRKIRNHNSTIEELRQSVRSYLKIDSMP